MKHINNNGFDYVDLNLPSGTLWATMNAGADKPTDYGLYFQWGDPQGCSIDQIGIGRGYKEFSWTDYKFSKDRNGSKFSKYKTNRATLGLEDDAAHVNMGGDWHMPSSEQIQELINETTSNWIKLDGVNGRLFISKKNGKSIFIPAAGVVSNGSLSDSGNDSYVWSSTLSMVSVSSGQYLGFDSGNVDLYYDYRCSGFSVRGVIDKSNDNSKDKKNDMNEKLNLVEILKNAPAGIKLWSPIIGECELVGVFEKWQYPIKCKKSGDIDFWCFSSNGRYNSFDDAECVLFPSKTNHDWSKFEVPKKHKEFKPFQKVLRRTRDCNGNVIWTADFYSHYEESSMKHFFTSGYMANDNVIIPYDGNEDKLGKPVV